MTAARRDRIGFAVLATALIASSAEADPQWNSSISLGVAGVSDRFPSWDQTRFFGGVGGDVLFLRDGPRSVGLGPSLEVATAGFSDFRAITGARVLLPLGDLWGVGLRPGAFVRSSEAGVFPGLSARAWFGIQTYNYDGAYAPRGGITFGYDRDVGGSSAQSFVIVAEVDGLVLALPALLLYQSLRGRPSED